MHDFFHDVTMKNAAFMQKLTRKKEKTVKKEQKIKKKSLKVKKIMQKWKKITIVSMLMVSILCVQVMEALADTPAPVQVSTWEDLVAAVSASSEGDVIELMDAITVPCGVGLNATGRITLKRGNAQGSLSTDWNFNDDTLNSFDGITFDGAEVDASEPFLNINANTQVLNCEFKNCKSNSGTVSISAGQVTFNGCTFKDNQGQAGSHLLIQTDKKVTIQNSTFTGGQSGNLGGAISVPLDDKEVEITGCTITGNSAANLGGAIYNRGSLTITSSKVFGNTADKGADIYSATPVTTETMLTDLETIYADENIIVKGWLTESNALGEVFMKLDYETKPEPTEPPSEPSTEPPSDEPSTEEPSSDPTETPSDTPGDDSGSGNSGASGDGTPSEPSQNPSDAPSTPSGNDSPGQSTETPSEAPGTTETPSSGDGSGQQSGNTDNSSSQVDNSSSSTTNDSHNSTDSSTTSDSHNSNDNNSVTTTDSHNTSTTDTSDRSTTTTDSSSHSSTTDNSKTTTKNDNRSYTYNYDTPASPGSKESGAGDTIIINEDKTSPGASQEVLEASSEAATSVPESKDPSNNISIDAEGVNVSFKVVDGVYSIDIKGNGGQTPGQVQEVVQQESPEKESKVNVYEIIKILMLAAILVISFWKPRRIGQVKE